MSREIEEKVIAQYQEDEENMILVFVQWCVNRGIDPIVLYQKAYPDQPVNNKLRSALDFTVPKDEAEQISDDLLLEILDFFGNYDLAQVVYEEKNKRIARENDED
ncbi:hypothetical protein [Virgibacillus sp. YIM 98842]|jgi:predicted AlkP superfamily phosphohydrolase/phosphomutase|uniref:hypothetical protein n=1 Tax=Virgibacillus sp. YIM 98842 TaxID=2663533 RepID=UPI0013D8E3B1|nr:hypothetical protein [Virgibacillus sp. YIM 98842]